MRDEQTVPDCGTCIHRDGCPRKEDGGFCTSWRSQEPPDRGPNPNDAWERGEDYDG